jgi:hypothetical protein
MDIFDISDLGKNHPIQHQSHIRDHEKEELRNDEGMWTVSIKALGTIGKAFIERLRTW